MNDNSSPSENPSSENLNPFEAEERRRKEQRWQRIRGIPRWIKISALVLLAAFIIGWNFLPAHTIDKPVLLERDDTGQLKTVKDENSQSGGALKAHAGVLEAKNNTSSTSSSSHSNPAYLTDRSIAVFNFSDHLLMNRIGAAVLEQLKKDGRFQRVEYYPAGHYPETGSLATDLFVTLDLDSLEESGVIGKKLNAKVIATLGISPARSNNSVTNHLSPPVVRFFARSEIDHQSELKGVESSAAQYEQQGANIAAEVAKNISNHLKTLREKHESLPDLSAGLYPAYAPTPEFDFLNGDGLNDDNVQQLTSLHGFCFQNETFWRVSNVDDAKAYLEKVYAELNEKGWKGEVGRVEETGVAHQRMNKDGQFLEVFSESRRFRQPTDPNPPTTTSLFVRYRNPMTTEARNAVYEEWLAEDNPNIDRLVALQRFGNSKQRARMIAMIKANPPNSATAWMVLAHHYQRKKDQPALLDALKNAHLLTHTMIDSSSLKSQIDTIAKKEKIDVKQIEKVDPQQFAKIGMPVVRAGSQPQSQTIDVGQTASFYVDDGKGERSVITVIFHGKLNAKTTTQFDVTVLNSFSRSGRGWSRSSFDPGHERSNIWDIGKLQIVLKMSRTDDGRLAVTIQPRESKNID